MLGTAAGPHPFPSIVKYFQKIIGEEAKQQFKGFEKDHLPDIVVAAVGGGSNAIGMFTDFVKEEGVRLVGVEPAGYGIETGMHGAPLGHGDKGLIGEAVFTKLAQKYGKSNVQIILRWHIQEGTIVFPRTTNPQHMKENFEIFDFELSADEMAQIRALDCGKRFFNMTLAEQEANLGAWHPAD